jgi:hypothetical protein
MAIASHKYSRPSIRNAMLNDAAIMKKHTSLTKLRRATLNGRTNAIAPATTAVMKLAAPMSSPTAKLPLFVLIAANVEKTSGLPLPNAKKVTPARLSLSPSRCAIVLRLMQKKSLAAMPIMLKSRHSHSTMAMKANGCTCGAPQ